MMRRIQAIGFWRFNYFLFLRWLHKKPETIDEFFIGLECIPVFMELESLWQQV